MPGPANYTQGNVAQTFVLAISLTPSAVSSGTAAEQTFTVTGLLAGFDQISAISYNSGAWPNLSEIASYRVSANNTLAVTFQNSTGGSLTPPSGTYLVEINRTLPNLINNVYTLPSAIV
jgi:hypothetical protein